MIIRPNGNTGRLPSARLPNEYQEVEYIQSSGTQYINTGLNASNDMELDIKINYSEVKQWGAHLVSASSNFLSHRSANNGSILWHSGSSESLLSNIGISTNVDYEIKVHSNITINGTEIIASVARGTVTTSDIYYVGAYGNAPDDNVHNLFGKLYYCKIWTNNILQRDFVPCYRKSDNVIGLLDLVHNVFYTNAGTGTFTKGADKGIGYTEVEYIESSGTQYIDSGVYPHKTTVIFKAANTVYSSEDSRFFSCYSNTAPQRYYAIYKTSTNIWRAQSGSMADCGSVDSAPHEFIFNDAQNNCYIDGQLKATSNLFDLSSPMTVTAGIMANHLANGWEHASNTKRLWYMIVIDKTTNTMIRNFVPCYRNSDNEVGLYDLVGNTFYTNSGTGVFTAGDIVKTYDVVNPKIGTGITARLPSAYQEVEYIQSSGTQYIDTGVNGTFSDNILFKYKYLMTQARTSGEHAILGDKNSSGQGLTNFFDANSTEMRTWGGSGTTWIVAQLSTNTEYTCELKYNKNTGRVAKINGVQYSNSSIANNYTSNTDNFGIFNDYATRLNSPSYIKLYYMQIYKDNTLVRDFIPCYRNSDNTAGLYDLVNNVFYTNAGTGTFIIPPQTVEIKNVYLGETRVYGDDPTQQLVNYAMLYDAGDECASITGGYVFGRFITDYGTRTGTGEKRSTSLYVKSGSSESLVSAGYFTTNKINLADFSKAFYNIISVDKVFTCRVVINPTNRLFGGSNLEISTTGLASIATGGYSEAYVGFGSWAYGSMIETNAIFVTKQDNWQHLCTVAGLTPSSYIDEADLCSNSSAMNIILGNQNAVNYMIKRCTGSFMGAFAASSTALTALNNSTYKTTIQANGHWAKFLTMVA